MYTLGVIRSINPLHLCKALIKTPIGDQPTRPTAYTPVLLSSEIRCHANTFSDAMDLYSILVTNLLCDQEVEYGIALIAL